MSNLKMLKFILLTVFLALFAFEGISGGTYTPKSAYQAKVSNVQVHGTGVIVKILPDDNAGDRHQRFILKLPGGQTILVAHNIDLAPRIESIKYGGSVEFFGEYEWNSKGGVVHWTHHDPAGKHPGGWLQHEGRRYE